MSDDPNQRPDLSGTPGGSDAAASTDATVVWSTGADPVPPTSPAETPPASGGLISAAPVAGDRPIVQWAPPSDIGREVPGAPGLKFADTPSRFVAYVVDAFIAGIISSIVTSAVAGALGIEPDLRALDSFSRSQVNFQTYGAVGAGIAVGVSFLYFVLSWSGGRRATIGQRIFGIQIGNAFDGRSLSMSQAIRRWLALGSILGLVALVPRTGSAGSGLESLWLLVLLVSTVASSTKQGLHDKFANSAVVRPAAAGTSGLVWACVVVIGLLVILGIVGVAAFLLAGDRFTQILSEIGNSI